MSSRTMIWILVALFAAVFIFVNARAQFKSAQNIAIKQRIENARITVTGPKLERKTFNEQKLAETLGTDISTVSVYGVFNKKIEYSVIFTEYKTDLQDNNPVFNLVTALKDYNFKFSSNETYGDNGVIIKVSGTFERGGKHGIEAAYIKKGLYLWQIVAAFPFSEENKKKALDFIDSAVIDPAINGAKPETKE